MCLTKFLQQKKLTKASVNICTHKHTHTHTRSVLIADSKCTATKPSTKTSCPPTKACSKWVKSSKCPTSCGLKAHQMADIYACEGSKCTGSKPTTKSSCPKTFECKHGIKFWQRVKGQECQCGKDESYTLDLKYECQTYTTTSSVLSHGSVSHTSLIAIMVLVLIAAVTG